MDAVDGEAEEYITERVLFRMRTSSLRVGREPSTEAAELRGNHNHQGDRHNSKQLLSRGSHTYFGRLVSLLEVGFSFVNKEAAALNSGAKTAITMSRYSWSWPVISARSNWNICRIGPFRSPIVSVFVSI